MIFISKDLNKSIVCLDSMRLIQASGFRSILFTFYMPHGTFEDSYEVTLTYEDTPQRDKDIARLISYL